MRDFLFEKFKSAGDATGRGRKLFRSEIISPREEKPPSLTMRNVQGVVVGKSHQLSDDACYADCLRKCCTCPSSRTNENLRW